MSGLTELRGTAMLPTKSERMRKRWRSCQSGAVYVVAPVSTIDPHCATGDDIPIEERAQDEVLYITGVMSMAS